MSDLNVLRMQHIIASGVVAVVGASVAYLSFTQQPAEAFLFPRLISTVFVLLAFWTFVKACLGRTKVGAGVSATALVHMLPGLVVMAVYVFWAAKALGFYTATGFVFFALYSLYDPAPHDVLRVWIKRAIATLVFVAVLYGLFALLLNVFTPREVLF